MTTMLCEELIIFVEKHPYTFLVSFSCTKAISVSWSLVTVSVKLISYTNRAGIRADGRTCDSHVAAMECDHRFIICLDGYNR